MGKLETAQAKQETFNRGDLESMGQLFAPTVMLVDHPNSEEVRGQAEVVTALAGWKKAFSDARISESEFIETAGGVVSQFIGRGTHDGTFAGLEATGRSVALPTCEVFVIDAEGLIARMDLYYDRLTILEQLGATVPQAAAV
jgi:steroid delta-isomerase-like uncharacterized protein